ncbi:hypothetical protein Acr_24g0007190 [Actinidia rufa]|uniref:Uncharacterized protein n=1 Tax=Actinidia rufa TaxID=165716 RepID=A0A7J0GUL9_9ERIC|nr:hypothetical protein Acr_24g0007190 [Actinidia rufa]
MEALSPKIVPGLAEVPSLGATAGTAPLLAAAFDVALDLARAFARRPFLIVLGQWHGTFSSWPRMPACPSWRMRCQMSHPGGHFSPITTPFTAEGGSHGSNQASKLELELPGSQLRKEVGFLPQGLTAIYGREGEGDHLENGETHSRLRKLELPRLPVSPSTSESKILSSFCCLVVDRMGGRGELVSLPQYYYYAYETSPLIGNELGKANVVEIQDPPNDEMDWKTKTDMKSGLIKGHLAWASRRYGLVHLKKPDMNTRWKRA